MDKFVILGKVVIYDPNLPEDWVENFIAKFGWAPQGHFVWCYDEENPNFGTPFGTTEEGKTWVRQREAWADRRSRLRGDSKASLAHAQRLRGEDL